MSRRILQILFNMVKKLILSDGEYKVLCKILLLIPPSQLPFPDFDGADFFYYRELCTHVLKKNYRFPDTDDDPK